MTLLPTKIGEKYSKNPTNSIRERHENINFSDDDVRIL